MLGYACHPTGTVPELYLDAYFSPKVARWCWVLSPTHSWGFVLSWGTRPEGPGGREVLAGVVSHPLAGFRFVLGHTAQTRRGRGPPSTMALKCAALTYNA